MLTIEVARAVGSRDPDHRWNCVNERFVRRLSLFRYPSHPRCETGNDNRGRQKSDYREDIFWSVHAESVERRSKEVVQTGDRNEGENYRHSETSDHAQQYDKDQVGEA